MVDLGFRKEKGALTFFAHVEGWKNFLRLLKADIVGCFSNIDHALLNSMVELHIGEGNPSICNFLSAFFLKLIEEIKGAILIVLLSKE